MHSNEPLVRLYDAVFNRAPDAEGLAFWNRSMDAGLPFPAAVNLFMAAPEFERAHGAPDTPAFVNRMYADVLDRPGEPEGVAHWTSTVDRGALARADVVAFFSESPEHVRNMHQPPAPPAVAPPPAAVANARREIGSDWYDVAVPFADGAAAPPVAPTADPPRGEVNVLVRGQSNAQEFAMHGADRLEANLEVALGVNVTMVADYWNPYSNTIHSGTAFMDWGRDGQQASLLRAVDALPATVKDNPTVTVWMHNEYDQGTATLTTQQWMAEVGADAALVRGALGQTAASTPYLFVPVRYPYGDNFSVIQEGMNQFDRSATFNARQSYDAYTGDILMDGWSGHMSPADALVVADKLTDDLATMFRQDIAWA